MACWLWAIDPKKYPIFVKTGTFAIRKQGRTSLEKIRRGDVIFAYLSGKKAVAGMFEAVGSAFQDDTPLISGMRLPHRLRVRPLVALAEENRVPYEAFHDQLDAAGDYRAFRALVQQVIYPLPRVDEKVLEFLVRTREATDVEKMIAAYDAYVRAREQEEEAPAVHEAAAPYAGGEPFEPGAALEALIRYIEGCGFVYEPWQVAAYATALRTKPFVILAGVSGTGKSRLPALVEAATGGTTRLVPVRPDWTDSADVLGYVDLQGRFRPGVVLDAAREAMDAPGRHLVCIVDEMNLARVEHYFAEILSRIEGRWADAGGRGFASPPLLAGNLHEAAGGRWASVHLPPNMALVGTVNMDESTHSFSRKVLDRAFTLELAEADLKAWRPAQDEVPVPDPWPVSAWQPRAITLSGLPELGAEDGARVDRAVEVLMAVNEFLMPAQVQVAYRTRDEVVLFLLHASAWPEGFRTRDGAAVDPLDLALHMKVLPRLIGGSPALRQALLGLLGWAAAGAAFRDEADARSLLDAWQDAGRPLRLPDTRFPRTAARLCLMWERLASEGFTSFWL